MFFLEFNTSLTFENIKYTERSFEFHFWKSRTYTANLKIYWKYQHFFCPPKSQSATHIFIHNSLKFLHTFAVPINDDNHCDVLFVEWISTNQPKSYCHNCAKYLSTFTDIERVEREYLYNSDTVSPSLCGCYAAVLCCSFSLAHISLLSFSDVYCPEHTFRLSIRNWGGRMPGMPKELLFLIRTQSQ